MTGGVRLVKKVTEHEETVDLPLLRADVQVERVPINRVVLEAPPSRQEGDTLIVPILEEVLVTEKRLMLKEEVRITRTQTEVPPAAGGDAADRRSSRRGHHSGCDARSLNTLRTRSHTKRNTQWQRQS